jgi:hypothetical protein
MGEKLNRSSCMGLNEGAEADFFHIEYGQLGTDDSKSRNICFIVLCVPIVPSKSGEKINGNYGTTGHRMPFK